MKKLKDADLEIVVDTDILKLKKKIRTKNKVQVQGMAVWCKFVSATVNEKSSSGCCCPRRC